MKKQIIVVESDPRLRDRWEHTLEKLRKLGYESGCLAAMPDVPGNLLKGFIEGADCFVVLGSPGRPKVESERIYDAFVALGYDMRVCLAARKATSRYDVGFPPSPADEGFPAHALLLSAFLAGMKYVSASTRHVVLARFDSLPASSRNECYSPIIHTIYSMIASGRR